MSQSGRHWARASRLLLLAVAAAAASGCQGPSWFNRCNTIPAGAIPEPAGVKVARFSYNQAMKAEIDDFVIYQYEWDPSGRALSATGRRHVNMLAHRIPQGPVPCQVIIETTGKDPELDQQRREIVVAALAGLGLPDADALVRVDYPEAEPMYGQIAPMMAYGYMRSSSPMMGMGGGGGMGMGGGGMGMGGMGMGGMGGMGGGMGGGVGGMGGGMGMF